MSGEGTGADRDVDDDEMPGPSQSPPNQHTREVLVTGEYHTHFFLSDRTRYSLLWSFTRGTDKRAYWLMAASLTPETNCVSLGALPLPQSQGAGRPVCSHGFVSAAAVWD